MQTYALFPPTYPINISDAARGLQSLHCSKPPSKPEETITDRCLPSTIIRNLSPTSTDSFLSRFRCWRVGVSIFAINQLRYKIVK
ncbi:hypothetical protein ACOSP7_029756 [Xanthoceras sorbifolium]